MSATSELVKQALKAQRRSALVWSLSLVLLVAAVLAVWPAMRDAGSLDTLVEGMPPEVVAALGIGDLASPVGFLNGNLYALLLPLLFAALAVVNMTALTAGDEDAGRLEMLLALPVSRQSVYLCRAAAVTLVLAATGALVGLTIWAGGVAVDMGVGFSAVAAATGSLFLFALFYAGLALALSGLGLRAGAVQGAAFGVLAASYLVGAFFPLVGGLRVWARISPWQWAFGDDPLVEGVDPVGALLLLVGTSVLVLIGVAAVARRTIRAA